MRWINDVFFYGALFCIGLISAEENGGASSISRDRHPRYELGKGPVVVIDAAHSNFHTADGRFRAFSELLKADGYRVDSNHRPFSASDLEGNVEILVIANALNPSNDMNWKLPTLSAFSVEEINAVEQWVANGGALLLIADHMPFSGAARDLAEIFGFQFNNGFAFGPTKESGMRFDRESGTLLDHEITRESDLGKQLSHVMSFSGQAFLGPRDAVPLLILGEGCYSLMPKEAWQFDQNTPGISVEGWLKGATLEYGKGRICVFGDAAGFTTPEAGYQGEQFGFNSPGASDNSDFVLKIMRWLSNRIEYERGSQESDGVTAPVDRRDPAPPGYHVFRDDQDRALTAKILQYQERSGKVKLFLENGTSRTVSKTVFSADDQNYIGRWFKAQNLMSKQLTVSVSEEARQEKRKAYVTDASTGDRHVFTETTIREITKKITIKNDTESAFRKLVCEWRIAYDQEKLVDQRTGNNGPQRDENHTSHASGRKVIGALASGDSYTVSAEPFTVFDTRLIQRVKDPADWMEQRSRVRGVLIKLSIPLGDGEHVVREWKL